MSIFTDKDNLLTFSTSENVLLCAGRQHRNKKKEFFTYYRLQAEIIGMTKRNIDFKIKFW